MNAPGTISTAALQQVAKIGATQVEPGHGLTGMTPIQPGSTATPNSTPNRPIDDGASLIFGFRIQAFVTRARVAAIAGLSSGNPSVASVWVTLGNVSIEFHHGTFTELLDDNGAGKSTLVKCLAGIYQPDSGSIAIDGVEHHIASAQHGRTLGFSTSRLLEQETDASGVCGDPGAFGHTNPTPQSTNRIAVWRAALGRRDR